MSNDTDYQILKGFSPGDDVVLFEPNNNDFAKPFAEDFETVSHTKDEDKSLMGRSHSYKLKRITKYQVFGEKDISAASVRSCKLREGSSNEQNDQNNGKIEPGYLAKERSYKEWAFSVQDTAGEIYKVLKKSEVLPIEEGSSPKQIPGGLIVICGETGASKSQHACRLIHLIMNDCSPGYRKISKYRSSEALNLAFAGKDSKGTYCQATKDEMDSLRKNYFHLLTFEEPIEDILLKVDNKPMHPVDLQRLGIYYSPRQLLKNFREEDFEEKRRLVARASMTSLQLGLEFDALRLKPNITLVGESRTDEDIASVLKFAGTGHLVITTMHAGSIQEALGRLAQVQGANSAQERGEFANRIRAIIHLKNGSGKMMVGGESEKFEFCVPSIWLGTQRSVAGYVKDGPRSVIAQNVRDAGKESGLLGRLYFGTLLLRDSSEDKHFEEWVAKCEGDLYKFRLEELQRATVRTETSDLLNDLKKIKALREYNVMCDDFYRQFLSWCAQQDLLGR